MTRTPELKIFKVLEMPEAAAADAVYFVKGSGDTTATATVTDAGGEQFLLSSDGINSATQAALDLKADAADVNNVDNTSDANKPISTAAQTALDLKAPLASPTFTGTPAAPTPSTSDNSTKLATTAYVTAKVAAATAGVSSVNGESGAITLDKTYVGLSNVDNTADTSKPVSTATQTALDLKADLTAISNIANTASVPCGRLSLTTGVSVPASDVTGATSIYYTPVVGLGMPVYDGTNYKTVVLSGELTLALDADSGHTGYHQSGKLFDLFYACVSGSYYFGTGPAWSSDTARASAISLQSGIMRNTSSMTLRHGSSSGNTVTVPAGQGTYLGTFAATADGQATDSKLKRLLFNAYHQVIRNLFVTDAVAAFAYKTAAFQQFNANTANQIEILSGTEGVLVSAHAFAIAVNTTTDFRSVYCGIGVDSTTVNSATKTSFQSCSNTLAVGASAWYEACPGIGRKTLKWLHRGNGSAEDQTWFGTNSGTAVFSPGLSATVIM